MTRTHHQNVATRIASGALAASALLVLATACRDSGVKPGAVASTPSDPVVVQQPATATQPGTIAQPEGGSVIPANVSYSDAESTFRAKQYEQATAMFAVYAKAHPANAWGRYMLGLSAWRAGQLDDARAAFGDALELDPKHVKSMVNLSRVLLEQDRPSEAKERLLVAVAIDSGSSDAYRVLGRTEMLLGNAEAAIESYRAALSIDPEDTWSMNNMGLILIQQGRFEEALRPLARATQLSDGVAVFHNNLGIALERTGRYEAAAESYRATLAVDSGYAKASANLARVDGREDEQGVEPVTVAQLGDSFANEVSGWREQRLSQLRPALIDSATVKSETTVSKVDSTMH